MRNGFHQTSMQDVIKEAGLSVGAFYRYFTSKSELIKAIATEKVGMVVATVEGLLRQEPLPPLLDVLDEVLGHVDRELDAGGAVRIAVQVWGEAAHDPEIAAMVSGIYGQIRDSTVALAARAQRDGQLPAGADPVATGTAIFGFVQGYILQNVTVGRIDRTMYLNGLRSLLGTAPA